MKKPNKKFVLVWVVCYCAALIIKGILDSYNSPTIMYIFAWIPILICFVHDYIHIKNKMEK